MLALGVAAALWQLVRLRPVDPAEVGEEQQPVVGRRDEEVLDDVVAAQLGAPHALAAAALRPVGVRAGALGVAVPGDRDDDLLLGDQVLGVHVALEGQDLRSVARRRTCRRSRRAPRRRSAAAAPARRGCRCSRRSRARARARSSMILWRSRAASRRSCSVEDRVRLLLVDRPAGAIRPSRASSAVGRAPDQRDDLVERVERLDVAAVDVRLALRLGEQVPGAADDDLDLVVHPVADELVQAQRARHAVDEREHVARRRCPAAGCACRGCSARPSATASRFSTMTMRRPVVPEVSSRRSAMPWTRPLFDQLGDLERQVVGVDLVRQLGDDQAGAALDLLDVDDRAAW